ncbi:MAG: hypothetical protein WCI59_21280, partial [Betaproteobacteria bacterium]
MQHVRENHRAARVESDFGGVTGQGAGRSHELPDRGGECEQAFVVFGLRDLQAWEFSAQRAKLVCAFDQADGHGLDIRDQPAAAIENDVHHRPHIGHGATDHL